MTRVSRRILWFLLICFAINFIDRTNIGFAALTMNKDLGLSATTFGLAGSALSLAYLTCEIPSNLILERVGARKWLARIMITWGIASAATMFAQGQWSLIGLRMLVGIAEAGFAPGLVLYMTYWYPQYHRARAQVIFMIGQPLAGMFGSLLSGLTLGLNGAWGLKGWQWLFLLEGLPAVVCGAMIYFYLADKPKDAKFLSAEERATLVGLLERDEERRRRSRSEEPRRSVTRQLLARNMLLISFAFACLVANFNALALWTPQIIRAMSTASLPFWFIGVISAIPSACSILWMIYWTRRSDRQRERFWHCVAPMLVAAAGWVIAASFANPPVQLFGLVIASAFSLSAWPVFFTLPSIILPREAHAAGLAFINTVAIGGSMLSPLLVGALRDATGSFAVPMAAIGCLLVIGVGLMLLLPKGLLDSADTTTATQAA